MNASASSAGTPIPPGRAKCSASVSSCERARDRHRAATRRTAACRTRSRRARSTSSPPRRRSPESRLNATSVYCDSASTSSPRYSVSRLFAEIMIMIPSSPNRPSRKNSPLSSPFCSQVLARVQEHDADDDVGEHLQHAGGRIGHVAAAEREHAMIDRRVQRDGRRADQRKHRQHVRDVALVVAQEHVDEQHRADREREEDLRGGG